MEELLEILEEINPDADFENDEDLIKSGALTSLQIVMLIAEIDETFDVKIPPAMILPENFKSAKAIYELIQKIEAED